MRFIFAYFICFIVLTPCYADDFSSEEIQNISYGEIFLADRSRIQKQKIGIGISFTNEFGNPYLNSHFLQLRIGYSLSEHGFFQTGISVNPYYSKETELFQILKKEYETNGKISFSIDQPQISLTAFIDAAPLQGYFNFLAQKSFETELHFRLEIGQIMYKSKSWKTLVVWVLGPRIYFTRAFGIDLLGGQKIDDPISKNLSESQWLGQLGFFWRV